jgi:hypothetical protein
MFVNLVAFNVSWISVVVDPVLSIFTRIRTIDLVFMLTAIAFNLLIAGIFIASKRELPSLRKVLGVVWMLLAIPFAIVFINYVVEGRELWILICFGLVFFFIFLELFLDFILKIEFREKPITHIPYIIMEYIALFSLVAIATSIDQAWGYIVGVAFWILMGSLIYLYWDSIKKLWKKGR